MKPLVAPAASWAYDTFRRFAGPFIGLAAVVVVLQLAQQLVTRPLQTVAEDCLAAETPGQVNACSGTVGGALVASILVLVVFVVLTLIASVGVYRAALRTTRGAVPSVKQDLLTSEHLGSFILTQIVAAILVVIGLVLCIIPGLILIYLFQFSGFYAIDRGTGPIETLKASARAVRSAKGAAFATLVFGSLVMALGVACCGLLSLVTLPFVALFTAHMYRQFNGEPIASAQS